jgi:hypothetical protein
VKFKSIVGTVDRLLSIQGDIYVLTTEGLFCLFKLVPNILVGSSAVEQDILQLPIEAADANTVDDRWLVFVGADSVFRIDTAKMQKSPTELAKTGSNGRTEEINGAVLSRDSISSVVAHPHYQESNFEAAVVS